VKTVTSPLHVLLRAMKNDPAVTPAPGAARTGHDRVLIIDDEEDVRDTFAQFLEHAHFDVAVAAGGSEGLELLHADRSIRLVLLDLNMPNMDGWRFRHEQRSDPRLGAIPTIIVTGAPLDQVVHRELDAADYLLKPVGRDHLVSVVARYCEPHTP
jgi:CheY-like chemotaxis protein